MSEQLDNLTEKEQSILNSCCTQECSHVDCNTDKLLIVVISRERAGRLKAEAALAGNWVPCSERLPKPWIGVLTWSSLEAVMKCHYRGDGTWGIYSGDADIVVTHWQPLPAPPEQAERKGE